MDKIRQQFNELMKENSKPLTTMGKAASDVASDVRRYIGGGLAPSAGGSSTLGSSAIGSVVV